MTISGDWPVAYDVAFEWDESHGRLVKLLGARPDRGVVIDLGCGYAPHGEPLRDAGFTYVGFDLDEASVAAVRRRGFSADTLDLADRDAVIAALDRVAVDHDERVVGLIALDVIEHLVEPHLLLDRISTWLAAHDRAVLGVSVPNVAYRDLAVKLLGGRWDVTPTGLLDHTHLRFFTDRSLDAFMGSASFSEVVRDDRPAPHSDQHWPSGSPLLSPATRLGALLRRVRESADDHSATYQFIRLYEPVDSTGAVATVIADPPARSTVFLSVLADPSCSDDDITAIGAQLSAQTNDDWELICAADLIDAPIDVRVGGGVTQPNTAQLDAMSERAQGAYVAVVGPLDQLDTRWVEQFAAVAFDQDDRPTGAILRCGWSHADGDEHATGPSVISGEIGELPQVAPTAAFPVAGLRSMRMGFGDGALAPAVSLLLDAWQWCGVVDSGVTAVVSPDPAVLDESAIEQRLQAIDRAPVLMAPGVLGRIDGLRTSRLDAEQRLDELTHEIDVLRRDSRWFDRGLRPGAKRAVRRLLRRPPVGGWRSRR